MNSNPYKRKTFIIPNVKTEYWGKLSLRYFGPVVWDIMLPEKYKNIEELKKFQLAIKE